VSCVRCPNLVSFDPGVGGRGYDAPDAEVGVTEVPFPVPMSDSEEVEWFPKGFLRTGYGVWSSEGTGGASAFFLKALRIDAKEGFLEKAVLEVANDG